MSGRRRVLSALAGLLVALAVVACTAPGQVSTLGRRLDVDSQRAATHLGNLDRRTSETSYRTAVTHGASEVFAAHGVRLSRPLKCRSVRSTDRIDTTCSSTTVGGRPVLVRGSSDGIDQPNPEQHYRLSVGGEQVWQGSCLGAGCRLG